MQDEVTLIVISTTLSISSLIAGVVACLLFKNRNKQPIKSRSGQWLYIEAFGICLSNALLIPASLSSEYDINEAVWQFISDLCYILFFCAPLIIRYLLTHILYSSSIITFVYSSVSSTNKADAKQSKIDPTYYTPRIYVKYIV